MILSPFDPETQFQAVDIAEDIEPRGFTFRRGMILRHGIYLEREVAGRLLDLFSNPGSEWATLEREAAELAADLRAVITQHDAYWARELEVQ